MILKKIRNMWQNRRMFVIIDPADNSVTLSSRLFSHMRKNAKDSESQAKVFVFKAGSSFGFMPDPQFEQPTQICDIQYNDKHRCIGFETLCPSVGQMLYAFGLPASRPRKISVEADTLPDGRLWYKMEEPKL